MKSRFPELLGIRHPIIQGPFGGGLSSVALTAAVSNEGGLGSFGMHHLAPAQMHDVAREIRAQTNRPFALNLWVSDHDPGGLEMSREQYDQGLQMFAPYYEELGMTPPSFPGSVGQRFEPQSRAILEIAPPVFSFVFGVPEPAFLQECRARGIRTLGTATTEDEAIDLEQAGVDAIAATGFEAGGHRVSWKRSSEDSLTGTLALIPRVVDRVEVPVAAAGGIADGRGVAAALALGAEAAQVGTAFLACDESGASALHRARLFTPEAARTALTRSFTGRLARGIKVPLMELPSHLPYPLQSWFVASLKSEALRQERADLLVMWAGQAAPLLRHRQAAELLRFLVQDTQRVLASL